MDYQIWSEDEKHRLRNLFLDEKLPIMQIAAKLARSTAAVNNALTRFQIIRQRSPRKCLLPTQVTPALARVHAHVCGDGHLFAYKERDHYGYLKAYRAGYYRRRFGFGYTNLRVGLLQSFMHDVGEVFGLTPRHEAKYHRVVVRSKAAWELLQNLGAGKSRNWWIAEPILSAPDEIVKAWLQAFFDDEACFVPNGGIRVRSVNRPGLEQVASMLRRFMPCHFTPARGLYPDHSCYLVVLKLYRPRFLQLIGSLKFKEST
ncbi:MAG: hypothetical protein HYY15_00975 [Candidatus Omnitrophica bacterium]|nr:hypothetical protein [Candidatus Omnitrophota bacterium]